MTSNCIDLKAETGQRCVYYYVYDEEEGSGNSYCKSFYDDCSKIKEETACKKNIPANNLKKCKWEGNACTTVDRSCSEFVDYEDKNGGSNEKSCKQLKPKDNFLCLYFDDCEEYPKGCEVANGSEEQCSEIYPLNSNNDDFDPLYKCAYSGNTCSKVKKQYCDDFDEDYKSMCMNFKAHNTNKICMYKEGYYNEEEREYHNEECNEIYLTCDNYNDDVKENERNQKDCEAIEPRDPTTKKVDPHSECYFNEESKKCALRKKECEDLDKEICNEHVFDDTTKTKKRCLYHGNQCKEIYKTCEDYNNEIQKEQRKEEDCNIIESTDEKESFLYKCILTNDENKICKKEKKDCEDYNEFEVEKCSSLSKNLDEKHKCALVDDACIKQAKICTDFNSEEEGTTCDAIVHEKSNFKCALNAENQCKEVQKSCYEYKGKEEKECNTYKPSIDSNKCSIGLNNTCQEIYTKCDDYKGNDKDFCDAIQITDITKKCLYETDSCNTKAKICTDAKVESECNSITPTDNEKQCAFVDSKCIEQYKTCELYKTKGSNIDKDSCESIIIKADPNIKCEFIEATDGQNAQCKEKKKECKDLFADLNNILLECNSMSNLNNNLKKCSFDINDLKCKIEDKTCLDFSHYGKVDDDFCKQVKTSSSNKVCSYSEDEDGCIEIDNNSGKNTQKNSAVINNLNIIMLIALCLLV